MAFTLDTKYLIAHLRQSFEVHEENEHIKKIIKPINAGDLIESEGTNISIVREIDRKNQGVYSPPIGFDSEAYMEAGLRGIREESKNRNEDKVSEEHACSPKEENTVCRTQESNLQIDRKRRQKAIRSSRREGDGKKETASANKEQKKNKIKRFFQGGKREKHPPSDSEDSSKSQRLELRRDETKRRGTDNDSTSGTENSSLNAIEVPSIENSDVLTIDGSGTLDSVSNFTYTESNVSDRLYLGVKGSYDSSDTLHQQESHFNEGEESNETMSWFGEQEEEETMDGNGTGYAGEDGYDKAKKNKGEKQEAEDDGEREKAEDDYDENEDVSTSVLASTDSAFTDIDSTVGSSILLDDSYSEYSDFNLENIDLSELKAIEQFPQDGKGKMDFDFQDTNNDTWRKNARQNIDSKSTGNTLNPRNKQTKKATLQFDKVKTDLAEDVKNKPKTSNLSRLIESKHDSLDTNPLNYYSFVATEAEKTKTHQFNVFLPSESRLVFSNLKLPDYVAIADCIGFILLRLTQSGHILLLDANVLDPNCWRLELVDEDGENYGSFGVLDRSKYLSSYNNPSEIAICKINDRKEVIQNEKQTPLPFKLRENIQSYRHNSKQQQVSSKNANEASQFLKSHHDSVAELRIFDFTKATLGQGLPQNQVSLLFSKKAKVGDLLREYCLQRGLSPSKYKFREANVPEDLGSGIIGMGNEVNLQANSVGANSLATVPTKKELNAEELVGNLKNENLDIVPLDGLKDDRMNADSFKEAVGESYGITPSYALSTIAPQIKHEERRDFKKESKHDTEVRKDKPHLDKIEEDVFTKSNLPSELSMNMLKGDVSIFPVNINTIYFQWSVWRRKPTLLNKFERSLIIDGDYVHLAPSEVTSYKKSTTDNPFSGSHLHQHHHHHHHHLHHYNYANYYNSLLMKTSSFHITQIIKLKQYRISKNPSHFKIVINKASDVSTNTKESNVRKKYDLEAVNAQECEDILNKIKWVQDIYRKFNSN